MHKISNRIFEIFFKKTLDFLLAGFRERVNDARLKSTGMPDAVDITFVRWCYISICIS